MGVSATVRRRLDQLSDGLDRERLVAWGVCQAVHLGLWALQVGLDRDGRRLLRCGAAISEAGRQVLLARRTTTRSRRSALLIRPPERSAQRRAGAARRYFT